MVQDLGDKKFWKRPGKDTPGISATTGYGEKGDWLYVFSTSTGFKAGTTYDKFAAYAVLHHNGDSLPQLGPCTDKDLETRTGPAKQQQKALSSPISGTPND